MEKQAKGKETTLLRGGEEQMKWTDVMTMMQDEILDETETAKVVAGEAVAEEAGNGKIEETDDVP